MDKPLDQFVVPKDISYQESILRGLYHLHVEKTKTGEIKVLPNAFAPREREKGVSVMRLDYTTMDTCKFHMKVFQSENRKYVGFAKVSSLDVVTLKKGNACAVILSSPEKYETHSMEAHAEIIYYLNDEIVPKVKGAAFPADVSWIMKQFCKISHPPLVDSNPDSETWDVETKS